MLKIDADIEKATHFVYDENDGHPSGRIVNDELSRDGGHDDLFEVNRTCDLLDDPYFQRRALEVVSGVITHKTELFTNDKGKIDARAVKVPDLTFSDIDRLIDEHFGARKFEFSPETYVEFANAVRFLVVSK